MERPFEQWKSKEVARLLALVETERRYYQELVANLPVSVAVVNTDRTLMAANRAFRQTFGLRGADLRSRPLDQILPSSELAAHIQSVLDSGSASQPLVIERPIAGSLIPQRFRVSLQPIRDWDEDTDWKALLVAEQMAESTPALAAAAPQTALPAVAAAAPVQAAPVVPAAAAATAVVPSGVPDPLPCVIWTATIPGPTFSLVSRSAKALLGVDPADWTGSSTAFAARIHPEDRERTIAFYDQFMTSPGFHSAEFRMSKPDTWYRETILVEADHKSISGVITDITARRAIEEQMLQSQRLDAISALAGRIAHDINNPLMIVNGYAEDVAQSFSGDDVRAADMRQIQEAGRRISDVTGVLQSVVRKQVPAGVPVAIDAELSRVVEHMIAAAGEYLKAEYRPGSVPLSVLAEAGQLEAVLLELSAALVEGGGESAHLVLSASPALVSELARAEQPLPPGHYVEISIVNRSNSAPQVSSRLFESLLPGKDANREAGPALAKTFKSVQDWGGIIHTVPGANEIRVYLKSANVPEPPAARPTTAAAQAPAPATAVPEPAVSVVPTAPVEAAVVTPKAPPVTVSTPQPAPPPPPPPEPVVLKTSVMIVEDEPGIRALMRKILQRESYDVLEAGSGPEALEMLKAKGSVDLLITDVLMPGMTGRELAQQVQTMDEHCAILYMSGFTADTGVETGQFPPGSHFLQKPFTLGSLLRKVNEVLASTHPAS